MPFGILTRAAAGNICAVSVNCVFLKANSNFTVILKADFLVT